MEVKKLNDGSFLVATGGKNIHTDHIHIASDGVTILSHKVNGQHDYTYAGTRRELSSLWEEITGEANKFPRGWNPS